MGSFPSIILLILLSTFSDFPQLSNCTPDYTTLVFKICAPQPLQDPSPLPPLFSSLLQQSSTTNFFKTTSTGSHSYPTTTITALYQCRGDLTLSQCHTCVTKLPLLISQLCGQVTHARVQLLGCYLSYETTTTTTMTSSSSSSGTGRNPSSTQMLFKDCSSTSVAGNGFQMRRDSGLKLMENGIVNRKNGYYGTNYQGVYVLGQCEGDLKNDECGECIKSAVEKGQIECGGSLAGQVYLEKCFIGYRYYPGGIPVAAKSSSSYFSQDGSAGNKGKTVATIVGVTAGAGFLIILVLFIRGLKNKE